VVKFSSKYRLNEEQLKQLRQIAPEAFKDNELDFNSLYEALSDFTGDEDNEDDIEQFGLSWPGKRNAKRNAAIPPVGTLVPVPGNGVDEENTRNIYIEGDNLEVLKIIKKAYQGKIKMIYIDPPYNTGNDYIYDDDFSESVESYRKRTGQVDENGLRMNSNSSSDGRFHSKWCSMIYPRLRLAREMLSEDGVIFISIYDNEVAQLLKICDEIFGEDNFVALLPTIMNLKGNNDEYAFAGTHEFTLVYCHTKENTVIGEFIIKDEEIDDFGYFKKGANLKSTGVNAPRKKRPNLFFPLYITQNNECSTSRININDIEVFPITDNEEMSWRWEKRKFENEKHNIIINREGNNVSIYKKQRPNLGDIPSKKPKTLFYKPEYSSGNGTQQIKNLFGTKVFSNPKPLNLIKDFLEIGTKKNSIILDFFSGSATTAHSLMQLNAEDGGTRKFIMMQWHEICDKDSEAAKANFKNICEIGKERIRRAGKKVKEEAGLNADNIDTGFKVFRLAPSNYKAWENYTGTDIKQLEELFKEDSLRPGWKEDDLLIEVMLLEGFPLDSKIEPLPQLNKNKVKKVSSDFHENSIYICLDKEIHKETINDLKLTDKDRFICLDSAVDDQSKITLEDKNFIKTL